MRSILRLCLILLVLTAQACSRPPDFHPPDRPPTFEGIIIAITPRDVSTGVIEVARQGQGQNAPSTRQFDLVNATIILVKGDTYPRTFGELDLNQRVRVWSDPAAPPAAGPQIAQYVEYSL